MERVERALLRIERAVERGSMQAAAATPGRDKKLRARVAEVLGELDAVIREASHG